MLKFDIICLREWRLIHADNICRKMKVGKTEKGVDQLKFLGYALVKPEREASCFPL